MTAEPITVRASYLSSYADCPRRAASRVFRGAVRDAGYSLKKLIPHIGGATGTATHAAVACTLTEKMKTGEMANQNEADQAGLESLDETVRAGVKWDGTSPDLNTAQKQVIRQHHAYRKGVAGRVQPVSVETRLEALHTATGFVVSGQSDLVVTTTEAQLRDLKTGVNRWANAAQYGTYSMLLESHGTPVMSIIEDYVPRARIKDAQPAPQEVLYPVEKSKMVAASVLRRMRQDIDAFVATDGNPLAFMANPNSILCSENFCPAWGSGFCTEHL